MVVAAPFAPTAAVPGIGGRPDTAGAAAVPGLETADPIAAPFPPLTIPLGTVPRPGTVVGAAPLAAGATITGRPGTERMPAAGVVGAGAGVTGRAAVVGAGVGAGAGAAGRAAIVGAGFAAAGLAAGTGAFVFVVAGVCPAAGNIAMVSKTVAIAALPFTPSNIRPSSIARKSRFLGLSRSRPSPARLTCRFTEFGTGVLHVRQGIGRQLALAVSTPLRKGILGEVESLYHAMR